MRAMLDELVGQYFSEGGKDGIYLTVWFDGNSWDDEQDSRRVRSMRRDTAAVSEELAEQATELDEEGYRAVHYLLDASLR